MRGRDGIMMFIRPREIILHKKITRGKRSPSAGLGRCTLSRELDVTYSSRFLCVAARRKGVTSKDNPQGVSDDNVTRLGQQLPDWIEKWNPELFRQVGYGLVAGVIAIGTLGSPMVGVISACPVGLYWWIGLRDMNQEKQSLRRNFPVLANIRHMLESTRPGIRRNFIESDLEGAPFSRLHRLVVYRRASNRSETLPFGTRRDVYKEGHEWLAHSMYPVPPPSEKPRVAIGGGVGSLVKQPYDAALLNVGAMAYGALSDNAILALGGAAKRGGFYHNTGEAGISRFHLEGGGPLVWNISAGYFGCRQGDGSFDPEKFRENSAQSAVKMIEVRISQGAMPGYKGVFPAALVTPEVAKSSGIRLGEVCYTPPTHPAFDGPRGMVDFVDLLRELSGGKPVGVKMCVGQACEVAALVRAMVEKGPGHGPDFFSIDGAEGGTAGAPPEFSDSVGTPLVEGIVLVDDLLTGAGIRDRVKVIANGKVISGFSIVRNIALGADLCNAARAMMLALGCIQALKCNTLKCPTGVATLDPKLMNGLVVSDKTVRVQRYQEKTVHSAVEIMAAAGVSTPGELSRRIVTLRQDGHHCATYEKMFPSCEPGSLLDGSALPELQNIWEDGGRLLSAKPGGLRIEI